MTGRRTRVMVAAAALAAALVALLGPVAPASAITSELETCLRGAANFPGGVLVITDGRISAAQATALRTEMWGRGRLSCVYRDSHMTTARAAAFWAALPAYRRPDTVIVGARGDAAGVQAWVAGPLPRRIVGSSDSGFGSVILWPAGTAGKVVADRFLLRVREWSVYGGAWAGTNDAALLKSSSAQCAAAAADPNGVLVVGDSITTRDFYGIQDYLNSHGVVSCVMAQFSARITDMVRQMRATQVPLPKTIIFAVGNNDVFNAKRVRADIATANALVGKDRNVVWLTIWRTRPGSYLPAQQQNALMFNRVVTDILAARPHSEVINWYAEVRQHPSWQYDGIHLTLAGRERRYALMIAAAQRLIAASTPDPTPTPTPTPTG